jgi:hypothetical protein
MATWKTLVSDGAIGQEKIGRFPLDAADGQDAHAAAD